MSVIELWAYRILRHQEVYHNFLAGWEPDEIATQQGVSASTIYRWLKEVSGFDVHVLRKMRDEHRVFEERTRDERTRDELEQELDERARNQAPLFRMTE